MDLSMTHEISKEENLDLGSIEPHEIFLRTYSGTFFIQVKEQNILLIFVITTYICM